MHSTMPSTSSFSSANSNSVMNDCFDASGNRTLGRATYKMLLSGFRTDSQTLYVVSVTCSFSVILMGFLWSNMRLTSACDPSSSNDEFDDESSYADEKSISEYCDELVESNEILRLVYSVERPKRII